MTVSSITLASSVPDIKLLSRGSKVMKIMKKCHKGQLTQIAVQERIHEPKDCFGGKYGWRTLVCGC